MIKAGLGLQFVHGRARNRELETALVKAPLLCANIHQPPMLTRRFFAVLVFAFWPGVGIPAIWYAAPNASANGNGSFSNPWSIYVALASPNVKPGDTVYLRGGTYIGPGIMSSISGTSNQYVTVSSCPNEWAVISDGAPHILQTTFMSDPVNNNLISVSGLPPLTAGTILSIDTEQFYVLGPQGTNWWVYGTWSGTAAAQHFAGTPVYVSQCFIEHTGSYVTFRDFEITSTRSACRVIGVGYTNVLNGGLNLQAVGHGNKAINLIVHNVGHPGIGFWQQGNGGEINGCIMWGNGDYDTIGTWVRGDAVYGENTTGDVYLRNNISFWNLTTGMKGYGTTIPVVGFHMENNIAFGNPEMSLQESDQNIYTSNCWMVGNVMMVTPMLSYTSIGNTRQYFYSNTIVDGSFGVTETTNSVYTNNTVFMTPNQYGDGAVPIQCLSQVFTKAQLNNQWDHNTYYIGKGDSPWQWGFRTADGATTNSQGGGNLLFGIDHGCAWKDWSAFDSHSVCVTNWPTNYTLVQAHQLDYDTNRWYVVVVNTSPQTNATLDLATLGFAAGQAYVLIDAQNYPVPVASGQYGGPIQLPLTLTNMASVPGVTNFVPQHTNIQNPGLFNAFVVRRIPGLPPTQLRTGSPGS